MTKTAMETDMNKSRKLMFQLAFGGLVGGLAGYSGAGLLNVSNMAGDQVWVGGIGLVYLLIGFSAGFGLFFPKLGSSVLNFEDADEIRDQKRILTGSAVCMIALGAALVVLPMAGPSRAISPLVGLGGMIGALALLIVVSIRDWKYYDEMLLQLSRNAGNIAFCGIGSVLLIWASAASLGLISAPTPLGLVAIIAGGFLAAIFAASARMGLLRPR